MSADSPPIVRVAVDVGGTFTDLVTEDEAGGFKIYKSPTTPDDPVRGMLEALALAAGDRESSVASLLASVELFVHGTTRATNAIINGDTARTALLVTDGHPDLLLFREGTRVGTFDYSQHNPAPYVPRALTFEVSERIGAAGEVVQPLDEDALLGTIAQLAELEVEAVAVCFLWSMLNGAHERRVGDLLAEHLPGVPFTLSSELIPTVREYRRASAVAIDASLKPLMTQYLESVSARLREAGLAGQLLMMTSSGGVRKLEDVAAAPIHSLASGPAGAPVAGRHYAARDGESDTAVVTDAGGTSYDVSLVRRGVIPSTRAATLGTSAYGYMTGFPSVDVKSIGAGGGSIAWVDEGGVLHVGPQSAGAVPGPACYSRGGTDATVTDASLVVGYLDPAYFLGGRMPLDPAAAEQAIARHVAEPLGMTVDEAAAAVLELQIEHMVGAIESVTLTQGVDPGGAVLVAGGGSAGFYSVAVARRLGCARVIMSETAAALSAIGFLFSDLSSTYLKTYPTNTGQFDFDGVNEVLAGLGAECEGFASQAGSVGHGHEVRYSVEARYQDQIWELEVPLRAETVAGPDDVATLRRDFDRTHEEILAHMDPGSEVDFVTWCAQVRCPLRHSAAEDGKHPTEPEGRPDERREAHFIGVGRLEATVLQLSAIAPGEKVEGPAVIQSTTTTVVLDPGAVATRASSGSLVIEPGRVPTQRGVSLATQTEVKPDGRAA